MELKDLRGLGKTRLDSLSAMGICSLRDLLVYLPVSYQDTSRIVPCAQLADGTEASVQGILRADPKLSRFNGITRVTATFQDASGTLPMVWYNQPWICQQLKGGEEMILFGRLTIKNGRKSFQNARRITEPAILPVYHAISGIPAKTMRSVMELALQQVDDCCPETLPRGLRMRYGLCEKNFAIREAHFPSSVENLKLARTRLSFEQMLLYQAYIGLMRRRTESGFPLDIPEDAEKEYWRQMPFPPTGAQARVLHEIYADMRQTRPMSRLVQGDVGCGKTALAFGALWAAAKAGYQGALMAPTEILARQHLQSARAALEPLGLHCGLLVGSMKVSERKKALAAIAGGEWDVIIGTHALLSTPVHYARLGLVVTDEQHRFGVKQRSALQQKGAEGGAVPHVLVMSATPIPRTLALILYGDLDLSVVDELPPGRKAVTTRIVPEEKREAMYGFLRKEVAAGRQAYVVCPLVEDSEALNEVKSATALYEDLRGNALRGLRVGLTYGKQGAEEKAAVLDAFVAGTLDVLVSTTVIEVGVNVPNASVMIIENAERYGLSQLHQLRGRVGRGQAESWCFLLADANERLKTLAATGDGFVVAQKDLELRGPGDLFGTRQSGEAVAGFLLDGDVRLLDSAVQCMKQLREDERLREERAQVEAEAARVFAGKLQSVALN